MSPLVQALPSLHAAELLVCAQPVAGLQVSSVHGLPSEQLTVEPPRHAPPTQVSLTVQASPSLHAAELLVCVQPLVGLHASSVQGFPSLQLGGGPPTHAPPTQVSLVVQRLPSSHGAVLLVCTQPVIALHESSVQRLLSLQFGGAPAVQVPLWQVSRPLQTVASSQAVPLATAV